MTLTDNTAWLVKFCLSNLCPCKKKIFKLCKFMIWYLYLEFFGNHFRILVTQKFVVVLKFLAQLRGK